MDAFLSANAYLLISTKNVGQILDSHILSRRRSPVQLSLLHTLASASALALTEKRKDLD